MFEYIAFAIEYVTGSGNNKPPLAPQWSLSPTITHLPVINKELGNCLPTPQYSTVLLSIGGVSKLSVRHKSCVSLVAKTVLSGGRTLSVDWTLLHNLDPSILM